MTVDRRLSIRFHFIAVGVLRRFDGPRVVGVVVETAACV